VNIVEILAPVLGILAFVGYVTCLSKLLWPSLFLTGGLAYVAWQVEPIATGNMLYWGAAAASVIVALLIAVYLPRPSTPLLKQERSATASDIVLDGTNVMYWDGDADLETLHRVVAYLIGKDRHPIVFLDASSRHHLDMPWLDEKGFAKALGLNRSQVMVCPAGTEADAFILKFAREHRLPVVSNDRFGDRAQQAKGLKLIKGGIAAGKPMLQGL